MMTAEEMDTLEWNARQEFARICPKGKTVAEFTGRDADDLSGIVWDLLEILKQRKGQNT